MVLTLREDSPGRDEYFSFSMGVVSSRSIAAFFLRSLLRYPMRISLRLLVSLLHLSILQQSLRHRLLRSFVFFTFLSGTIFSTPHLHAQNVLNLPNPRSMVHLDQPFAPATIKGIKLDSSNPFKFDFIIDIGKSGLQGQALKKESEKLIKYFLAALTIPQEDLWVNLSPGEKDSIIPESFGQTEMGRDLLAQDYLLKQITASLMSPEGKTGKHFWERIYEEAYDRYGITDVPINTFNKVWIVPHKAIVYQNGNGAHIIDQSMKVMLAQDYFASNPNVQRPNKTSSLTENLIREIILPVIEEEVNTGEDFSRLRQIYHSMILAMWFKQNLKESLLGRTYVDQEKVKGIDIFDKEAKNKIYNQYLASMKRGIFNFIKERYDRHNGEIIPTRYLTGGFDSAILGRVVKAGVVTTLLGLLSTPGMSQEKLDQYNNSNTVAVEAILVDVNGSKAQEGFNQHEITIDSDQGVLKQRREVIDNINFKPVIVSPFQISDPLQVWHINKFLFEYYDFLIELPGQSLSEAEKILLENMEIKAFPDLSAFFIIDHLDPTEWIIFSYAGKAILSVRLLSPQRFFVNPSSSVRIAALSPDQIMLQTPNGIFDITRQEQDRDLFSVRMVSEKEYSHALEDVSPENFNVDNILGVGKVLDAFHLLVTKGFSEEQASIIIRELRFFVKVLDIDISEKELLYILTIMTPIDKPIDRQSGGDARGMATWREILLLKSESIEAFPTFVFHEVGHLFFPPRMGKWSIMLDSDPHKVIYAFSYLRGKQIGYSPPQRKMIWSGAQDLTNQAYDLEMQEKGAGWKFLKGKIEEEGRRRARIDKIETIGTLLLAVTVLSFFAYKGVTFLISGVSAFLRRRRVKKMSHRNERFPRTLDLPLDKKVGAPPGEEAGFTNQQPEKRVDFNNDKAMTTRFEKGGIDFNPEWMALQTQGQRGPGFDFRSDTARIPLSIDEAMVSEMIHSSGLVPIVISITPIKNVLFEYNTQKILWNWY